MNLNYLHKQYLASRDIIFDLDNTIIEEKDYIFSAYAEIAKTIKDRYKINIGDFLQKEFDKNGRKNIYQKLIKEYSIRNFSLKDFKHILHTNKNLNKLDPSNWFLEFLNLINKPFEINIITNGNISQQKNKINHINWPSKAKIKNIIYANKYNKKPNPESFYALQKIKKLNKPIYIGDSLVDEKFASKLNIEFLNVDKLK